jgi:NitT/TauT family transport system substrate-binding protein
LRALANLAAARISAKTEERLMILFGARPPALGRRGFLGAAAALAALPAAAATPPVVRLGILPSGTVQWIADVITRHELDQAHGFTLATTRLANTEAAKVALMGHAVDIAVSDWPFVAAQRSHGGTLTFAPFSSSLGGIVVPAGSPVRGLADLKGLRLGVAGGPADKSWLIVQAAARKQGIDLAASAKLTYGAPPLLSATLAQGRLDALLTFWNFAARLETDGLHEAITVQSCAASLGLEPPPILVGYVFDAAWAGEHQPVADRFLAASKAAGALLASKESEWVAIRPLMDAPNDALYQNLRARFLAGFAQPDADTLTAQANKLLAALAAQHVAAAASLPPGVFWRGA